MTPLASITDLEVRLGESICGDDGQRARAEALLVDASALVRTVAGNTWTDEEGEPTEIPDLVRALVCGVAMRALRNPNEIESTQLGAVSVRFRSVWLTATETDLLANLTRTKGFLSVEVEHGYGWDNESPYWAGAHGGGRFLPVDYGGQWFGPIIL